MAFPGDQALPRMPFICIAFQRVVLWFLTFIQRSFYIQVPPTWTRIQDTAQNVTWVKTLY